jgi:hypothetical protein
MDTRFAVNMIGVGFSGNEVTYIAGVVKFNDYISALMVVEENEYLNDVAISLIQDIKAMWGNAADVNSFNHAIGRYTKHRILPFNLIQIVPATNADDTIELLKKNTMKMFKNIEIIKKDKSH